MDLYGHLMPGNESEAAGLLDAYLAAQQGQAAMGWTCCEGRVCLAPVSRQFNPDSTGFQRTQPERIWLNHAENGSTMRVARDLGHLRGHRRDPAARDRPRDLGNAHQV